MKASFEQDINKILDHRHDNGGDFCAKGKPSGPATNRYREILDNLNQ